MTDCKYTLKLNEGEKIFPSIEHLNAYLLGNKHLWENENSRVMYFATQGKDRTMNILDNMAAKIKDTYKLEEEKSLTPDEDTTRAYKIPNSLSCSRILESRLPKEVIQQETGTLLSTLDDDSFLVTPFNPTDWRRVQGRELKKRHPKWSEQTINAMLDHTMDSWEKLIAYGNNVHNALEWYIKNRKNKRAKADVSIDPVILDSIKSQFDAFISHMESAYHTTFTLKSEVPVYTEDINPEYKNRTPSIKSVNGRIDLLMIDDKTGEVFIVDFKISRRRVGQWNTYENIELQDSNHDEEYAQNNYGHEMTDNGSFILTQGNINDRTYSSAKKHKIACQLELYKRILEENGLIVKNTRILPFKLDLSYEEDNSHSKKEVTLANGQTDKVVDESKPTGIVNVYLDVDYTKVGSSDKHDTINPRLSSHGKSGIDAIFKKPSLSDNKETLLEDSNKLMSQLFPTYVKSSAQYGREVSVEDLRLRVQPVLSTDKKYEQGWRFRVSNVAAKGMAGNPDPYVYAKTMEDMERVLQTQINLLRNKDKQDIDELTRQLNSIMHGARVKDGNIELFKDAEQNAWIRRHFAKYLKAGSGWKLIKDDKLTASDIIVFEKDGKIDIFHLTDKDLYAIVKLSKGTSILGETHKDHQVDNNKIYTSDIGHLELMKTMVLLDSCGSLNGYKINHVSTVNMWNKQAMTDYTENLLYNYKEVCLANKVSSSLNKTSIVSTYDWAVDMVEDILDQSILMHISPDGKEWRLGMDANTAIAKAKAIKKAMDNITFRYELSEYSNPRTDIGHAYYALSVALSQLTGHSMYFEQDEGKWFSTTGGRWHTGTMINSMNMSPSKNQQTIGAIVNTAEQMINSRVTKELASFRTAVKKFLESGGRSAIIGNEVAVFKSLLRTLPDGTIDPNLRLKNPDDPKNNLTNEEKEVIKAFLNLKLKFQYGNNEERARNAGEDFYNIPLKRASLGSRVQSEGIKSVAKHAWQEAKAMADTQEVLNQQRNAVNSQDVLSGYIYNKYDIDAGTRKDILADSSIGDFELDLGFVFNDYVRTFIANQVYSEKMPELQAIQMILRYNSLYMGQPTKEIEEVIQDYIKVNVLGKTIMSNAAQTAYRPLAILKKIYSTNALALNYVSGIREMIQGMWINITRTAAGVYGKDQFSQKDLGWAYAEILKKAPLDPNKVTLLDALNAEYGMANMDSEQLAQKLGQANRGLLNFHSSKLFILNQIPDFFHRMGILLAKMKHDGLYEAHTIDENGMLVYDGYKDPRFAILRDPSANKDSKEYKEAKALYEVMFDQFVAEGTFIDRTDEQYPPFPRAYTAKESISIRSFSEMCFGHYDRHTQMMAKHTFIGALYLHFRTFLSSRMEQWMQKPGTYDQGKFTYKTNENGVRYVLITKTDNDGTYSYLDLESNVKPGDNWDYVGEWQGRYMEGILYTIQDLSKAIYKLDMKAITDIWNTEHKRANLIIFMEDVLLLAIIGALIKAIFMNDEAIEENTPLANSIMYAAYTSTKDGNLFNIVGPLATDWTPPMIGSITRTWRSATDLLAGDTTLGEFARKEVGVTRTLSRYA